MEILMIRHFQTKGNLDKRYIGKTDETLAETDHTKQLVQKSVFESYAEMSSDGSTFISGGNTGIV